MSQQALDTKINYQALEEQRTEKLQTNLKEQLKSLGTGSGDSLRRFVLSYVVEGKYEEAKTLIDEYISMKDIYSLVKTRGRYQAKHAKELIAQIKTKREFPNLSQLPLSKQQEILDASIGYFEELRQTIKNIENFVREEAVRDIRSTVWVLKTFMYTLFAMAGALLYLEFSGALAKPFWFVFSDYATRTYVFLAQYLTFL